MGIKDLEGCGGLSEQIPYQGLNSQCKTDHFLRWFELIHVSHSDHHHQDQTFVAILSLVTSMVYDARNEETETTYMQALKESSSV